MGKFKKGYKEYTKIINRICKNVKEIGITALIELGYFDYFISVGKACRDR